MKTQQTKIKVMAVGNAIETITTASRTKKVTISAIEIPIDNPYGKDISNAVPFDIEVHNNNIEDFMISKSIEGQIGLADIVIQHYKKDASSPTFNRYLLNHIEWQI